jgi:hypothetical protein
MQCNTGMFNITMSASFINANNYVVYASTSGNTTITSLQFARFIYDQTLLQSSLTTFIDSGLISSSNTNWTSLSLALVWKQSSNFLIGLNSIAYDSTAAIDFNYDEPSLTCTGASTFHTLTFGYWNYRYRTCPSGYPFFSAVTNLCSDSCGPYFYSDTTVAACLSCAYSCYTCSNTTTPTNCTSCNSVVNYRTLSGTTCICLPGYYDAGVATCATCGYTCATCTNSSACATCSAANQRSLISGQCPCNANYIDNGTALCVSCSYALSGCTTCTSTTVCTVCNTTANFTLNGATCACSVGYYISGSSCLQCSASIPGCQICISSAVCTSCNAALFYLNGSICSCQSGTQLSGSTCTTCTITGCANCTSSTVCNTCNATTHFQMSGSICIC